MKIGLPMQMTLKYILFYIGNYGEIGLIGGTSEGKNFAAKRTQKRVGLEIN